MFAFLGKWFKKNDAPPLELTELAAEPFMPAPQAPSAPQGPPLVDLTRVDVLQKMWGRGFSDPGSNEFYLSLARSLALDAQKNVLDLNAGLGGPARLIAHEFKTYVTGFERDAELAAEGMKISGASGQTKHAPISVYDPITFNYGKHADVVMAFDFMYSLVNKDLMLESIAKWLKPRGHLVMTDFVCEPDLLNRPPISLWIPKEPFGVHLVSTEVMEKLFAKHGFDLRVNEDITKPYIHESLQGLGRLARWLEGQRLSRPSKKMLADIVDRLAAKLGALDTGVKKLRYSAIKRQ